MSGGDRATDGEPRVTLVVAEGCQLCDEARQAVEEVCGDAYRLVSIDGDPQLEARYRELIPVVEVDGAVELIYVVEADALAALLASAA